MDNGWSSLFNNSSGTRGHNSHYTNLASNWDNICQQFGTSRFDWISSTSTAPTTPNNNSFHHQQLPTAAAKAAATAYSEVSGVHALMLTHQAHNAHHQTSSSSIYAVAGTHYHPDPHLMCLKLGKRHYFEDATATGDRYAEGLSTVGKKGRPCYGGGVVVGTSAAVTRCQVEGCQAVLVNAKEYHRRHKVCEMHSKAPKVVVLGIEQRFCQQCSRFHAVSEFDDSKRSCRRRLAGHNERRRKGSHDSLSRNLSQDESKLMDERFSHLTLPTGRALSLLSSNSTASSSWLSSSSDLSSRCSAALRDLIAENRAAILARQLDLDHPAGSNAMFNPEPASWADRFDEGGGGHVTLDFMQVAPSSAFGFLSVRGKSKEHEDECSDLWTSFGGNHVV